jgi:hypothetical protein
MWAIAKKSAVMAAAFLVLGVGSARAATMEFKAPFPFLVQGETLPAGQYVIQDDGSGVVSIRGERNNTVNMFVMTLPSGATHDPAGDKPAVTFKRGEKMWQLSNVWASPDEGRRIVG